MSANPRQRKYPGTGARDTPTAVWAALFEAYMAGDEPLTDVARRIGVLYSAVVERARRESWWTLRHLRQDPADDETIYIWQRYHAEWAHRAFEKGESPYLADALAAAPPADATRDPPSCDVRSAVVDLDSYRKTLH